MTTDSSFIDYLREQTKAAGRVTFRKMFGEYGVYYDDKIIALVCDNQMFIKPTSAGREAFGEVVEAPPYPGAKLYYLVGEQLDDPEQISRIIKITAAAMPAPKPKKLKVMADALPAQKTKKLKAPKPDKR